MPEPVRIGYLAGDFPWSASPTQIGKLLSSGVMARNMTRALSLSTAVIPYIPPHGGSEDEHRFALTGYLHSIDLLWADVYPGRSAQALTVRQQLDLRLPVVLNAQGAVPKALDAMLFPWQSLLRRGDGILFTCEADRTIWHNLVSNSSLHEWVAPLPIDETIFFPRTTEEQGAMRTQLGAAVSEPMLLYVGRINVQKNLHALLRLLAAVRKVAPNACLCCVGAEDDIVFGEFRVTNAGYVAFLQTLAEELGIADAVRFCGPLFGEELAQAYSAADLVVNAGCYHRENFGLSQAEAQACGTPVVCSDWGGFKEVILPGTTGDFMETVLTNNGVRVDWLSGARSVCALLQDSERRARFAARSLDRARERFSISAVAQRLQGIVEEVLRFASAEPADRGPAYEPSQFASAYEAHKRACGWYEGQGQNDPTIRYPRMFDGSAYALYERIMEPYTSRLAGQISVSDLQADWVPYLPCSVQLSPSESIARLVDPIWADPRYLPSRAFEVLRLVDGRANIAQVAEALHSADTGWTDADVKAELRNLHVEGFVLFGP